MEVIFCNTDFGHKMGEFCSRLILNFHFISFFRTDFVYESDGKLLGGKAGDMLIIPRGKVVYHGPTPEMKEGFRNDWMYIEGDDFINFVKEYQLPIGTLFKVDNRHILAHSIEKIKAEKAAGSFGYKEMCDLYLKESIIKLSRAYQKGIANERDEKIKNLRIKLMDDPQHNWTLESMASLSGYSQSHFSLLYNEMYGISPIADLINIRIENAKMMLACSSMTVSEISDAIGFSNIYYFSKCFKKNSGMSPIEYRRKLSK